jgi:hypothetical protein
MRTRIKNVQVHARSRCLYEHTRTYTRAHTKMKCSMSPTLFGCSTRLSHLSAHTVTENRHSRDDDKTDGSSRHDYTRHWTDESGPVAQFCITVTHRCPCVVMTTTLAMRFQRRGNANTRRPCLPTCVTTRA